MLERFIDIQSEIDQLCTSDIKTAVQEQERETFEDSFYDAISNARELIKNKSLGSSESSLRHRLPRMIIICHDDNCM